MDKKNNLVDELLSLDKDDIDEYSPNEDDVRENEKLLRELADYMTFEEHESLKYYLNEIDNLCESMNNTSNLPKCLQESIVFKKSNELLECERIFNEMVALSKEGYQDPHLYSEKFKTVSNILERYFNFQHLDVNTANLSTPVEIVVMPNAYTIGKGAVTRLKEVFSSKDDIMEKTDKNIRWKDNHRPVATITLTHSLIRLEGMTGSGLLAVVLHEIGHCFYHGTMLSRISKVLTFFVGFSLWVSHIIVTFLERNYMDITKNIKLLKVINTFFANIVYLLSDALGGIYSGTVSVRMIEQFPTAAYVFKDLTGVYRFMRALSSITGMLTSAIMRSIIFVRTVGNLINFVTMDGLSEERFADDFAAMHGYGPDLLHALECMNGTFDTSKGIRGESQETISLRLVTLELEEFMQMIMFDPHPRITQRPMYVAEFYKEQLKTERNPLKRKYIEEQIIQCIKHTRQYKLTDYNERRKFLSELEADPSKDLERFREKALQDKVQDFLSKTFTYGTNAKDYDNLPLTKK